MLLRLATLLLATPAYASFVTSGGVGCATRASRASAACMCDAAEPLLDVRELKASAEGTSILKGVNLQVRYARGWPCERGGRELIPPSSSLCYRCAAARFTPSWAQTVRVRALCPRCL